jgi:hypothetical protein
MIRCFSAFSLILMMSAAAVAAPSPAPKNHMMGHAMNGGSMKGHGPTHSMKSHAMSGSMKGHAMPKASAKP